MHYSISMRVTKFCYFGLFLSIIISFYQCSSGPATETDRFAGNRAMAAMLDSLNRVAIPMENYQLNARRAEALLNQTKSETDMNKKIGMAFQYATEVLNSGKTEQASNEFLNIISAFGGYDKALNDNTKVAYELLAVSFLRMGEQQNCVDNHTAASCIIPLRNPGFHKIKTGSEKAIQVYLKILDKYPDDLGSRWLLNIAYMTLGQYPQGVPAKWLIPTSVFAYKGNLKPFKDIAIPLGLDLNSLSGGVCMEDFNNDGFMDLFVTDYQMMAQCHLYLNKGDGAFRDATKEAKLTGIVGGLNTMHTDYDNDGNKDILILRGGWLRKGGNLPNSLLHNNGDGTFSDVTVKAGLLSFHPTQAGAWADFDSDGFVDLFIGNENSQDNPSPSEFYHNNGDGTFTEVSGKTGLVVNAFVKGASWGDINNDGKPDLYLSVLGGNNQLWVNRGGTSVDNWKFENIAASAGVEKPVMSFPCMFFDYNNDGYQDIFVNSYDSRRLDKVGFDIASEYLGKKVECELPCLYRNNGNETFTDVSEQTGVKKVMYTMGLNYGDLDNDGFLDFYCGTGAPDYRSIGPNRMFRNINGEKFEEVTMAGFGHLQKGHGIAFGDLDNDGDQDIYSVFGGAFEGDNAFNMLFQNPYDDTNPWVNITLEGKTANRAAIGAKVKINIITKSGSKRAIYHVVSTGASFGSNSLEIESGLGDAASIESVEVTWPKAGVPVSTYTGIALNTFVKLTEGDSKVNVLNRKKIIFNLDQNFAKTK